MRKLSVDFRQINLNLLEVHPRIQRDFDENHVRDIVSHWNIVAVNPLTVMFGTSGRNRKRWVVDGQHTLEAARRMGVETLWCKVISTHRDSETNEVFHLLNEHVKRVSPVESFELNTSYDITTDDYAISTILDSYDLTVGRDDDIRTIQCASALRQSFKKLGAEQFGAMAKLLDAIVRSGHRVGVAEVKAATSIARTFGDFPGQIDLIAWSLCRDFGQMRGDAVNSCVGVHLAHSSHHLRDAILERCAVSSEMVA